MVEFLKHLGYLVIVALAGAILGAILGVRWLAPYVRFRWPWLGRLLFGALVLLLALPAVACAQIQSIDTLWKRDSTATVDSTHTVASVDTVWGPWKMDTLWHRDSTIARIDTTFAPQPPLAGACANEPSGWTVLVDRHFANGADPGWGSTGAFSMVRDPSAPDGDGWIGRLLYNGPGLKRVGSATMASYYNGQSIKGRGYRGFYTCVHKRVSANFQTAPNNAQNTKQRWWLFGPSAACSENRVFTNVYGPGSGSWSGSLTLYPAFTHQCLATSAGTRAPSSGFFYNKAVTIQRGVWYTEEFMGHVESAHGTCDGWLTMYADGVLVRKLTGLCFTFPGEPLELAGFKWNNTIGGGRAPCTSANWKPANGAASQVIGGVTYFANKGVLPTAAQHPECFYPGPAASIDIDGERVLVH